MIHHPDFTCDPLVYRNCAIDDHNTVCSMTIYTCSRQPISHGTIVLIIWNQKPWYFISCIVFPSLEESRSKQYIINVMAMFTLNLDIMASKWIRSRTRRGLFRFITNIYIARRKDNMTLNAFIWLYIAYVYQFYIHTFELHRKARICAFNKPHHIPCLEWVSNHK